MVWVPKQRQSYQGMAPENIEFQVAVTSVSTTTNSKLI